jgi:hypothetical protein
LGVGQPPVPEGSFCSAEFVQESAVDADIGCFDLTRHDSIGLFDIGQSNLFFMLVPVVSTDSGACWEMAFEISIGIGGSGWCGM